MSNPFEIFETNDDLESGSGVVIDYPGFSVKINRAGGSNKKYNQIMASKMKPYRRQLESGFMDEELATKLLIEIYADSVILGWKDVKDKKGKVIPYNRENVIKLMTDLPGLFESVQKYASDAATFKSVIEEIEEKNSPKS